MDYFILMVIIITIVLTIGYHFLLKNKTKSKNDNILYINQDTVSIPLDSKIFFKMMDQYLYSYYKSKSGIFSNYHGHKIIESSPGRYQYMNPEEIPPHLNYIPYQTEGSGPYHGSNLLKEKDGYHYYLRFIDPNPFLDQFISKFFPDVPGYKLVSCIVSNRGALTNLHIDRNDGIQINLFGKKKWYIFHPKDAKKLGITHPHLGQRRSLTYQGPIDPMKLPKEIKFQTLITKPGDKIFITAGYPHLVETLENESVSIGYRKYE